MFVYLFHLVIFHIITDFYRIEPDHTFQKLVQKIRLLLIRDLKNRINVTGLRSTKLSKNVIQRSFNVRISNTDLTSTVQTVTSGIFGNTESDGV
jgi:hypothetical protein